MATNLVIPEIDDPTEGYEKPLDIHADGIATNGFYPQNATSNDQNAGVERDASENLLLKDAVTGSLTLAKLNVVGVLAFGASGVSTTTTTRYLWPWHEDSTARTTKIAFRVPRACTLQKLRVRHNTGAGNGNNIVYTVRKNDVATALTVTMASTATDGSDLTHTVAFAAGDLLDIEVTKAASIGTSPSDICVTLEAIS